MNIPKRALSNQVGMQGDAHAGQASGKASGRGGRGGAARTDAPMPAKVSGAGLRPPGLRRGSPGPIHRCVRSLLLALALLLTAPAHADCAGDCDGDGMVRIDEVVGLIACVLNPTKPVGTCLACADADASGALEVHELLAAVAHALDGCPIGGFTLRVYLKEFVGGGGYYRGACLRLEPLGRFAAQDLHSGEFRLDGVPPGRYELQPGCGYPCNLFGCWPRHVPVEIVDRDVTVVVPRHVPCTTGCDREGAICVAPDGFLCGVCRDDPDECTDNAACGTGRVCIPTGLQICPCDGSPALVCAPACGSDADCARGETCGDDGRCMRPACADDADCGADFCVLGRCYDERGSCQLPPP
jgi:hypothetical protein